MLKPVSELVVERQLQNMIAIKESESSDRLTADIVIETFKKLEEIHKKYFPKSKCYFKKNGESDLSVVFVSTVCDPKEWRGDSEYYDPMCTILSLMYSQNGEFEIFPLSKSDAIDVYLGTNTIHPSSVKVPFRKMKSTPDKIFKRFEDWSKKRVTAVEDNKDRIATKANKERIEKEKEKEK